MSVSTKGARITYTPNGSTTTFSFPYMYMASTDLVVQVVDSSGNLTTKVLGTDYSTTGAGGTGGGNVVFVTAPVGEQVIIYRLTNQVQSTTFVDNAAFPAATLTFGLDVLTLMIQDLYSLIQAQQAESQSYASSQFSGWSGNGNTPNGLVVGNLGDTVIDISSFRLWRKTTNGSGNNTGWN